MVDHRRAPLVAHRGQPEIGWRALRKAALQRRDHGKAEEGASECRSRQHRARHVGNDPGCQEAAQHQKPAICEEQQGAIHGSDWSHSGTGEKPAATTFWTRQYSEGDTAIQTGFLVISGG